MDDRPDPRPDDAPNAPAATRADDDAPAPDATPSADRILASLERGDDAAAVALVEALADAAATDRKQVLQSLRTAIEDRDAALGPVVPALAAFLTDAERAVRLTTAKLLVAAASRTPDAVEPVVDDLAARLADDAEFYYVRARCAEALGYVAVDQPAAVAAPEVLAELRVGLSFDEPEVREKLAKALEHVALGDPSRLDHHVATLAEHLDDDRVLVRYHLATALVVVGTADAARLTDARTALVDRLTDSEEDPYVVGRAAEALALLADHDTTEETGVAVGETSRPAVASDGPEDAAAFATDRLAFLRDRLGRDDVERPESVGTRDGVRATTADAEPAIRTPEADGECPHCGLALPADGPPVCPRCGAPN